jgi:transcriptional regulator GlxA family with amidase domain
MRVLLVTAGAAAVLLSLSQAAAPSASAAAGPTAAEAPAADRLVLPPPKAGRAKPLVVVVAENGGAETTDFVVPYGVLKDSGVAEVRSLSTGPGPVRLVMALRVAADQTLAQFDVAEPAGADVVVVPAQKDPKDPVLGAWLKAQARKGATIVSVCEGARVLAQAGLLDGRRATTHWHAIDELERTVPRATWVRDRRYLQDGRIISTAGVSASIAVTLALVEAIGGREAALATARRLGARDWRAEHRTADFALSVGDYARAAAAIAAVWRHETLEAPVADGTDEIGLALRADAWSRTFRVKVATTHAGARPVRSRHGLTILADEAPKPGRLAIPADAGPPLQQLDSALAAIARRYGEGSARLVRTTMEYPQPHARLQPR